MWPFAEVPPVAAAVVERPPPPDNRIEFIAPCDVCGREAVWKAGVVVIKDNATGHGTSSVATSSTDHCPEVAA